MTSPRDYLSQLNSSVIRLGLTPIRRLLESLHNPQETYGSVLIGGTNGKGSIAATIAAILAEAGYSVGLYTSPHLVDLRERICINGQMITWEALDALIEEVRERVGEEITYFEFLTALAFLHFGRMQVDIAVLEVGLGGRLDATNVVNPLVSVISNISLEHQEYLGRRLADIAREKGGIIKESGPCITGAKQRPVREVLAEICRARSTRLYRLGSDIGIRNHRDGTFSYSGLNKQYGSLTLALTGKHQIENAALALGALEVLAERGFPTAEDDIKEGLKKTVWEGRLEVLQTNPQLIVDGGHNAACITALCRSLQEDFSYQRLILIFAALGDKNFPLMLKKIAPLADRIIITRPETDRAVPPEKLCEAARRYHGAVEVAATTRQALKRARVLAGKGDLICATGSLYLVGEVKKALVKGRNSVI